MKTFLTLYLGTYVANRHEGQSHGDAYDNILFEVAARYYEDAVSGFLINNPDIQSKLQGGQALTGDDLAKIRAAIDTAQRTGSLKVGYQFVMGVLIYVPFPK